MKSARASLLIALLLAACSTTLERDLSEPQADEVVVALGQRGIGATKEAQTGGEGFAVSVTSSDVPAALAVLRAEGLPRVDAPGIAATYAVPSLVPTAGEEHGRASAALAADLARSIEALEGVHDARVHLGMPDPSVIPMDDAAPAIVASVLVRTEVGATVDESAIRALVAGAVPGLSTERVSVVTTRVPAPSTPMESLVSIGPFYVTSGSATGLRALLAAMLAINVGLAVGIGLVLRRRR